MKKIFLFIIIFTFTFNYHLLSNDNLCGEFKKYSMNYMKCKGSLLKEKTINTGKKITDKTVKTSKNIIKDTKEYQTKEWSEEKEKIKKIKEKVLD